MSRFTSADSAYIKERMLPRLPGCLFEESDYEAIAAHTHLRRVQARKWSEKLRFHVAEPEREAYLRAGDNEKVRFGNGLMRGIGDLEKPELFFCFRAKSKRLDTTLSGSA